MARNPNKRRCKARSKQTGERCKRWAKVGYNVCHYHGAGGGAPKGSKNAFKHGAYEKVVVERLKPEEMALFEAVSDEPDLKTELRILRFKLMRLLEPVEREMVIGTPNGAEKVTVEVDEVTKAYAIEKIVDGIRKLVKEIGADEQDSALDSLIEALRASKEAVTNDEL